MFRPVRKKKNEISAEAAKQLLHTERRGVFAVNGDDGYPYAVSLLIAPDGSAVLAGSAAASVFLP